MPLTDLTTVLVIEDEPPIRRLLRMSLGANRFAVLQASTGRDALEMISREKPEAIVLDLGLPDMDGLLIVRTLRQAGNKTPIIVLSSRGEEKAKVEALNGGGTTTSRSHSGWRS